MRGIVLDHEWRTGETVVGRVVAKLRPSYLLVNVLSVWISNSNVAARFLSLEE